MRTGFISSCLTAKAWLGVALGALVAVSLAQVPADARPSSSKSADPAVAFMEQVARDLLAGARTQSPILLSNAVKRYGDVNYIGHYSLGTYRAKLSQADRPNYLNGMVRFIGRYAASQVPKYPVVRYEIMSPSIQGGSGIMVDSKITLRDGSQYEVRWLLSKVGSTYRVRDAMVYGFWITPFLKQLFETYIGEQGGDVKALVVVLNR
ncbi:MAG TPA: ABC transporter substrate-binding protein [Hyphomicrobiaceae bacterium]|jgi:phospholipid transport system substrate-binding protein|nr:ABC transporter substrate-binding protein [Hyphomicrobiaceae bacterium]